MVTRKKTTTADNKNPPTSKKMRTAAAPKKADGFYIVGIGASAWALALKSISLN
jgi:hypothetical protein